MTWRRFAVYAAAGFVAGLTATLALLNLLATHALRRHLT